jgi:hypothetical protein
VGHFARIEIADRAHAVHHFQFDERGLQKIFESHACIRGIVFPRGCFRARLSPRKSSRIIQMCSAACSIKRLRNCEQKARLSRTFIKNFLSNAAQKQQF